MGQLQLKELLALSKEDVGRILSDGQSVQGEVRSLKAVVSDTKGTPTVSVNFRLLYRFATKLQKVYLGSWPTNSLSDIRTRRDFYRGILAQGVDPKAEIARQQELRNIEIQIENERELADRLQKQEDASNKLLNIQKRRERMTYREFFEQDFLPSVLKTGRTDEGDEVKRAFELDVFPVIGNTALEDVSKEHIKAIMDKIGERATRSQPMIRTKKKVFSDISQSLSYAFANDLIKGDPSKKIAKKSLGKEKSKDRVLSEQEIIQLMRKLPNCDISPRYQLAILITLATGVRVADELLNARWKQVDFKARVFCILEPKNRIDHLVHLSEYALSKFEDLHKISGESEWIFPSDINTKSHVSIKDLGKKVSDRQRGEKPALRGRTRTHKNALELQMGQWHLHDLRRTMATTMVEMDVPREIADRCLNHVEEDSNRRTYILAKNKKAMRNAWDLFGKYLAGLEIESTPE